MNAQYSGSPKKQISLRLRLALSFSFIAFLAVGISLLIAYLNYSQQLRSDLRQRLLNIVSLAALQQDGDAFVKIDSEQDPAFDQIRIQNLKIRRSDPDLRFVYTMRYDDQGIYFVVDAVTPGEPGSSPYGTRYFEPGPVLEANYKTMNRPMVESTFYTDEYGTFISAYAPFYTSSGEFAGIIGADITAANVLAKERQVLFRFIVIFIVILPLIAGVGWILGIGIAKPITALTDASTRIAGGELDYRPEIKSNSFEISLLNKAFFSTADRLQSVIAELEERVAERTRGLERRALQLQVAADVGRAVTQLRNLDELLTTTTQLITERFNFYHVGIFLLDEKDEYAVLRASNSEGGKRMLARGHKLKVGQVGIVGYATGTGEPRIALDVGKDAVFFDNPDLPETRSELALPLMVGKKVLGALDVQSTQEAAFNEDDITILKVLADQVAIAIDNARLISDTQTALETSRRAYREISRSGWERLLHDKKTEIGYVSLATGDVKPVTGKARSEFQKAITTGKSILTNNEATLHIPITIRGEVIGVIQLDKPKDGGGWTSDDVTIANTMVEQLGTALESARLYSEISQRAERENIISSIATKISTSVRLETILLNTVQELGKTFGNSEIILQLGGQKTKGKSRG